MICIKYNESDFLPLQADCRNFPVLRDWLVAVTKQFHFPESEVKKILVSADEIFANTALYAYPHDKEDRPVEIFLEYDEKQKKFGVIFKDYGVAFDPLTKSVDGAKDRVKNHLSGGLGLFLVHQFMDELKYERSGNCNIFSMFRKIREAVSN